MARKVTPRARIAISDAMRRQAFDYYVHHPGVTLNAIMVFSGVGKTRFGHLRREWSWPPRPDAIAAASSETMRIHKDDSASGTAAQTGAKGLAQAAAALTLMTRLRLNALIAEQTPSPDIDHDRTARTLASYAKTLTIARTLLEQEGEAVHGPECDDPARSLDDLRDELASHLERVVAAEEAGGSDGLLV